jgi:probable HAF family extracellular repeat protein
VNDVPDIVGTISVTVDRQPQYRAYFGTFDSTGRLVFTVLGTFGGSTVPSGINSSAEIAGYSVNAGGYVRAFYINGGTTLRDFDPNATMYDSAAYALNDSGVVVGSSNKGGPCPKGPNNCRGRFTYPVILTTAPITRLPSLGGPQGAALAINNSNVIVGWSTTSTQAHHAFRYSGGQMIDLNSTVILNGAGWLLTEASAINDSGAIAGHGTNPAGQDEIFVLTPQ